jgi:hypothetical protein
VQDASTGASQSLTNIYTRCWFYGANSTAAVVLGVGNTRTFEQCVWENCQAPAVSGDGAWSIYFRGCNFEVMDPGGTGDCLLYLDYNAGLGQPSHAFMEGCYFTNNAGARGWTNWDAIAYAYGSACTVSITNCRGALATSYLCKDNSAAYDTEQVGNRGLWLANYNSFTGYPGTAGDYRRSVYMHLHTIDPAIIMQPRSAVDTRWWLGITEDAGGTDNDPFEIGTGTTKGSNVAVSLASTGKLTANAGLAVKNGAASAGYIDWFEDSDVDSAAFVRESMAIVDLTNAQIKDLSDTPIALVAAPGAGKWLEFCGASLWLDYGSNALTESSSPDDLCIEYNSGTGPAASATITASGFITAAADTGAFALPVSVAGTAASSIVNKNLALVNTGTDYTGNASNDTVIRVIVRYRIHSGLGL